MREKLLIEKDAPRCTKSRPDNEEPSRVKPKMLPDDPTRRKLLKASELPIFM
jgi:hypothetical protein